MTVIAEAPSRHVCSPGWELRYSAANNGSHPLPAGWYWHDLDLPAGTVVECECGQVWVAESHKRNSDTGVWWSGVFWRPERWRERRRRRRSAR